MEKALFKDTTEAQKRSAELRTRREKKLKEKEAAEKLLADNLAAGKEPENLPSLIAGLAAEISGISAAMQTVDANFYRLKRRESIEAAEHIAIDYANDFENEVLPKLREAVKTYGTWLQENTLAELKGDPRTAPPTAGALDGHGVKDPMMAAILCLNMSMKVRPQPEPSPAATQEEIQGRPENRVRFGKDAVVSNGRGLVRRIGGSSDSGGAPGQEESRHGLGLKEIQVPGPRY